MVQPLRGKGTGLTQNPILGEGATPHSPIGVRPSRYQL